MIIGIQPGLVTGNEKTIMMMFPRLLRASPCLIPRFALLHKHSVVPTKAGLIEFECNQSIKEFGRQEDSAIDSNHTKG